MRIFHSNPARIIMAIIALAMMMAVGACGGSTPAPAEVPATAVPIEAPATTVPTEAPATTVPTEAPAVPDGATLLDTRCGTCHSVEKVKRVTATQQQWERIVADMINKGAKVSDAEKSVLIDHLVQNYGK
jgi:cytochrome c5